MEEALLDMTSVKGPCEEVTTFKNGRGLVPGGLGARKKSLGEDRRLDQEEGRGVVRKGQRSKKGLDKCGLICQELANCGLEAKSGLLLVLYVP